ncbi:hypothetical protein BDF19DRAFT_411868 [Syncephalis fuscata]|nr:hypothetical protein BDF19DRAFT_411868 [Syncephalis fuscata]
MENISRMAEANRTQGSSGASGNNHSSRLMPYKKRHNNKNDTRESNATIRKRIRDTERLLRRPTITADIKVASERRLKALQLQLEEGSRAATEKRRASKYKMVRFIEEQKVRRKLEKTKKRLEKLKVADNIDEQATDICINTIKEQRRLDGEIKDLEIDLNYVIHFPAGQKYIALFPTTSDDKDNNNDASEHTLQQRNKIREQIRVAMERNEFEGVIATQSNRKKNAKKAVKTDMDDFFAELSSNED